MPAERRTEEEIRREIAAERDGLTEAIDDLRRSVEAKRRPAARIGVALAVALVAALAVKVLRRLG